MSDPIDKPFEHDQLELEDVQAPALRKGEAVVVGTLERITFQNEENGFTIARFFDQEGRETFTVKGLLGQVREGETLKLWGTWEEHPTYGPQFSVSSSLVMEPTTLDGIERYLIANIAGIGETLARRIVKIFGHETFAVIDSTPEKLLEVPKFPKKVLGAVLETWQEQKVKREILVFLHSVGVTPVLAERIYVAYGLGAVDAIKDDPYRLALDIQGIGFRTADLIAARLGVARDSPRRAEAGTLYALDEAGAEGHTGLPAALLIQRATRLLEVPTELVAEAVQRLVGDGLLKPLAEAAARDTEGEGTEDAGEGAELLESGQPVLLFRGRYHRAEEKIATRLRAIADEPAFTRFADAPSTIARMEQETGLVLNSEQRDAVQAALEHKVLVITGGPGTGKTTIVRFVLGLTAPSIPNIALAAPTGKAAKRLSEATGRNASTIHRLLEAGPKGFQRGSDRPLEAELVIVDESSMIDTLLMEALLQALPDHARLILVGDVDQLPSVGPGRVLGDLIDSGRYPVARLEAVFRQAEGGRITANAHAIRKGRMPDLARPSGEELLDFYFLAENDPARIVDKIRMMVLERIPEAFGLDPRTDLQVLTPMHRGLTGAQNLNRMLQTWLNPDGTPVHQGDPAFRIGDRVMQTRNDYEKMVFNGDMGEISGHDPEEGLVRIDFDNREVMYERKHLDQLALGYAITVHKAQGSEYPAVLLPFTTHHAVMLQRNLLYTAITRGRKLVVVVGTEKAVNMAVHNARPVVRHTGLRIRLSGG